MQSALLEITSFKWNLKAIFTCNSNLKSISISNNQIDCVQADAMQFFMIVRVISLGFLHTQDHAKISWGICLHLRILLHVPKAKLISFKSQVRKMLVLLRDHTAILKDRDTSQGVFLA